MVGIDEIDRKILYLLSENPEMSQSALANQLGLSQPSISKRIIKLKKTGILTHLVGINVKKAGLFLAKVDVVTNHPSEILDLFQKCPVFLNGLVTSGTHNISILLIGEDISSIEATVDQHLRSNPHTLELTFDIVVTPITGLVLPIKASANKGKLTPCGKDCSQCTYYVSNRCLGCPSTTSYKGLIL